MESKASLRKELRFLKAQNQELRAEISPKGLALIELVEAGIIGKEDDGSINTDAFEAFWASFEKDLQKRQKAVFSSKRERSPEEASDDRHHVVMTFIVPALCTSFGYLLGTLLH